MNDFDITDSRKYELINVSSLGGKPFIELTQLEVLKLIKALKYINNKTLGLKLVKLIKKVDEIENEQTDFTRDLPRKNNGKVIREWQDI